MRKPTVLVLLISIAPMAIADVLWDQSSISPGANAYVNQVFADRIDLSSYILTDVHVPAGGWFISSITQYYAAGSSNFSGVINGTLNVMPKTGPLPTGDILGGPTPITIGSPAPGDLTVTANFGGSGLPLAAGDWWIGVTPLTDFTDNGQVFLRGNSTNVLDNDAIRNPGGGFGYPFGTDWGPVAAIDGLQRWQAATLIMGVPEPASLLLLGLGAVALLRRR